MSRLVSKNQREALETLALGAEIHIVHHMRLNTSAIITDPNGHGHKTINQGTVEALRVQGWLDRTGDPAMVFRGTTYVISAKGRAQLEIERNEDFAKLPGKSGKDMTTADWKSLENHLRKKANHEKKPVKVWNGRGDYRELDGHLYVGARTKKEACSLVTRAGYFPKLSMNEFTTYWSPCWGNPMEGITPEVGVWFTSKAEERKSSKAVPRRIL